MDIRSNLKISVIKREPFFLFEIKNFLDDDLYYGLKRNFPFINENLDFKNMEDFKNKKFAFQTNSKIYQEQLNKNNYFRKFHNIVKSKKFFNFFYYKFFFEILKSRIIYPMHIFKLLRIPKQVDIINKNSFFYNFSVFNKIKTEVQYSYILNGGEIVPHTDSGEKILSLMLYFSDYEDNFDELKDKEESCGTQFWTSKNKNFSNTHQEDKNSKLFKNSSNKLYKIKFTGRNLYGFIKNENSWHSVEPINVTDDYIRKSININFYI